MTQRDSAALDFLNSRGLRITILDEDGGPTILWEPSMACSVEDAVEWFCEERGIDLEQQLTPNAPASSG